MRPWHRGGAGRGAGRNGARGRGRARGGARDGRLSGSCGGGERGGHAGGRLARQRGRRLCLVAGAAEQGRNRTWGARPTEADTGQGAHHHRCGQRRRGAARQRSRAPMNSAGLGVEAADRSVPDRIFDVAPGQGGKCDDGRHLKDRANRVDATTVGRRGAVSSPGRDRDGRRDAPARPPRAQWQVTAAQARRDRGRSSTGWFARSGSRSEAVRPARPRP